MSEPFSVFLENPRRGRGGRFVKGKRRTKARKASKRRRSSSRRKQSRIARRGRRVRAVTTLVANPRRRRRSTRSSKRRRSTRRNPFRMIPGGNIKRTVGAGLGLAAGEFAGDLLTRVAIKVGDGRLLDVAKVPNAIRSPLLRIAVGLFAAPLLKMLRLPSAVTAGFGAVNVASGILGLSGAMRSRTFSAVGLGDYELADVLVGDDDDDGDGDSVGDVLVGVGDYELADYELAGDFSDQDYYLNYDA